MTTKVRYFVCSKNPYGGNIEVVGWYMDKAPTGEVVSQAQYLTRGCGLKKAQYIVDNWEQLVTNTINVNCGKVASWGGDIDKVRGPLEVMLTEEYKPYIVKKVVVETVERVEL